jgi:DUF1680 family protein/acetyl esterase/lipase
MNKMKIITLCTCLFFSLAIQAQEIINLYPGAIPNSKPARPEEANAATPPDMIRRVTNPTLEVYYPEKGKATVTAVVICPGGSYKVLVYKGEGITTAKEFAKNGVTAFVLKYRLPDDSTMIDKSVGPLQDAQQAIKLVRENAVKWGIYINKVGIVGFSAGGHLASTVATHFEKDYIENPNHTNLRPDFQVVVYPVISMQDSLTDAFSRSNLLGKNPSKEMMDQFSNELQVTKNAPPAYITHAADDKLVDVDNSIFYFEKLRHLNIPAEMHIYPTGGHGFIFRQKDWAAPLFEWMKKNGLLHTLDSHAHDKFYLNEFPLRDVVLLDGPFKQARDLNIQTLLKYDVDRLLQPFLKEAGLPEKGARYTNWAGLDGHVGGHYLSALAMNYAATGNTECKKRMDYMIAQLKACQDANTTFNQDWGVGYVGGVPNSKLIWPAFKTGDFSAFRAAWVPWYNVHKMYAGLRDAWLYAGNEDAKAIFLRFCDWAINITAALTDAQMQSMLDTEQGGMNEVLADAYQMTDDEKYLTAAKRFSHKMLLDPMSQNIDNLDNKHANTQVPKAIGFERIGELSHDEKYINAGSFFWQTVTANRSLAFGGNSRREFFPSAAASTDFLNDVEGPESCNSYNMLKLTEDLFRTDLSAKYMDYYERTVYNHILSTQNPETGGYVYFTPVRPRSYRVYSAPNEAMWCCVGSGMENHGKYNEIIYTHSTDSLFVNLFVASELNWNDKKIRIRQETKFPYEEQAKLTVTEGASQFSLLIRYPSWVADGALKILVNGKAVAYTSHPSSYVAIDRYWKKGDKVQVILPMHNTIEHMPNVPAYIAILHGPILLAAKSGTEDLKGLIANDSRWGHIPGGEKLPLDKAPVIIENDLSKITNKLVPVKNEPLHFTMTGVKMINPMPVVLQPFYQLHDARYMMYWMALTDAQYHAYIDSIAASEKAKLALQKRTIDFVAPGEQQPEVDHGMQTSGSRSGSSQDQFFREASNGGFFSYNIATGGETGLSLMVRYWGAEWGNRKFDIYINDEKLVTEDNTGRWNQSKFWDIQYAIPDSMVKDKDHIRVKFQSLTGTTAGAVYYLRLVRKQMQ